MNEAFDQIFPDWVQDLSLVHWTPMVVVLRAVQFLMEQMQKKDQKKQKIRVLDVGSGPGKFCLLGAMIARGDISSDMEFVGVEQRKHLVMLSKRLARRYEVLGAEFYCGDSLAFDWREFDAIYLYNPFEEHRSQSQRIDGSVTLNTAFFSKHVSKTCEKLKEMKIGSLVLTYHGFGGSMPNGYRQILKEHWVHGFLEGWVRER